jgi:hypothetical protein
LIRVTDSISNSSLENRACGDLHSFVAAPGRPPRPGRSVPQPGLASFYTGFEAFPAN